MSWCLVLGGSYSLSGTQTSRLARGQVTKRLPDHHASIHCTGRTSLFVRLQTVRHLRDKTVSTLTCTWLSINCRRWTVSAHQFIHEMLQLHCWRPPTPPVILRFSRLSCSFCAKRRHAHEIQFQFYKQPQATRMFLQLLPEFETKLNVRSTPSKKTTTQAQSCYGWNYWAKNFFIQPWRSFHELKKTGCNLFMCHIIFARLHQCQNFMWPPVQECYFFTSTLTGNGFIIVGCCVCTRKSRTPSSARGCLYYGTRLHGVTYLHRHNQENLRPHRADGYDHKKLARPF